MIEGRKRRRRMIVTRRVATARDVRAICIGELRPQTLYALHLAMRRWVIMLGWEGREVGGAVHIGAVQQLVGV